ncbi:MULTISPECIES: hypothetical protein [Bacillaceae]|uniref:hypothetical protein n=1 Tax=Bacillaceae TaxID=186817 RepID=UPI000A490808|nr:MULTISPECIES: hypothetical protein [Bacillus]
MMPANEFELSLAALLYYHVYEEELPVRDYRKQDIQYIIQKLHNKMDTGLDELQSSVVH